MVIHHYQGKEIFFTKTGGTWNMNQAYASAYRGTPYQLVEEGTKLKLMDPQFNRIYSYETSEMVDGDVRGVETIRDRNGNTHMLSYNPDGTLMQVTDGLGRSLDFTCQISFGLPRITRVTDQTGRFIEFAYNQPTQTSYTDPRGGVTRYGYLPGRALIDTLTRPAGNRTILNSFDNFGKVLNQIDGLGNMTNLSYAEGSTTITDPLGNTRIHQFNDERRLTGFTDEAEKTIQYEYDGSHRRTARIDRLGNRSSTTYDSASGKVTSRTDAEGSTWRYLYAPQNQEGFTFSMLARIELPDGTREEYSYDARGNLTTRRDPSDQSWNYSYNDRGQVTAFSNPAGGMSQYTYNGDGTLASRRDAAGNITTYGYDGLKRLNRINRPDDTRVEFTRDANDNLLSVTNEKGQTTRYGYDDNDNLTTITNALGHTWTLAYDADDNPTRVTDPLGNATRYSYDALQRIQTTTDANDNVTSYDYDARRRLVSVVDGEENRSTFSYDDEGVPSSMTNPEGDTWSLTSDRLGRITGLTDPLGNERSLGYDALSRLISQTNPLNQIRNYAYDARGAISEATLPEQISSRYGRNELGQVNLITDPRGKASNRAFDNMGRLTSNIDALGNATQIMSYDSRNRATEIDLPLSSLDVGYDGIGFATSFRFSDGTRLDYSYDESNRLTAASGVELGYDSANRLVSSNGIALGRDERGRMVAMTLASGKTATYGYDRSDRLTEVADWAGATTRLAYDDAGRLVSITRPNGVVANYNYDKAGRLVGITERSGEKTLASIALTKDGAGRTREATRDLPLDPASGLTASTETFTFDAASQVSTPGHSYDKMGRLTEGGAGSYNWNLASRLTSYREGASTVSFTYDAFGHRLTRSQGGKTRSYVWNYALGLPSVSILSNGTTTRYYIHTPGGSLLYSIEEGSNERRYYHYDEMGSTLFLTGDDGEITDSYAYTAYGRMTASTGTTDNPFTYGGRFGVMREPATSLYYMRARYYDSATGRFISRDPQGVNLADAKSVNLYHYAAQNPLRFVDPSGRKPVGLELNVGLPYLLDEDPPPPWGFNVAAHLRSPETPPYWSRNAPGQTGDIQVDLFRLDPAIPTEDRLMAGRLRPVDDFAEEAARRLAKNFRLLAAELWDDLESRPDSCPCHPGTLLAEIRPESEFFRLARLAGDDLFSTDLPPTTPVPQEENNDFTDPRKYFLGARIRF